MSGLETAKAKAAAYNAAAEPNDPGVSISSGRHL
jgi:hypothetical protein